MRRLIINADDFGLTRGVNRAIAEAHTAGIVTSATMMANGSAFSDAVSVASSLSKLSVGCHVVLVDGSPMAEASRISSLLPDGTGEFTPTIGRFAFRAMAGRFNGAEVQTEITAQVQRLQDAGISVSHLDSHKHTHVFPQILRAVILAAKACGIRGLRNPFEPHFLTQLRRRPGLWKRALQASALRRLGREFRQHVAEAGMTSPDGTIGIAATGVLDEELFRCLIANMPEGTWELVCHPGHNDDDLQGVRTRLRQSREKELRLLTSSASRQILEENAIQLISYADF